MKKQYTCIICPNGCDIDVEIEDKKIVSIKGNSCKRGEEYVRQEIVAPKRTISTSVLVESGEFPVTSVRLTSPIPKDMIFPCMEEIKKIVLKAPVTAGTVVIRNICHLESDLIVTKSVKRKEE